MPGYVIGDVQGCFQQLQSLLAKIQFDANKDYLWFCGDLVARGPDSLATLRFIRSLGDKAKVVLGNHDLHFLACAFGFAKADAKDLLDDLLHAPDLAELVHWLQQQPLMYFEPERQLLLVHAGLAPHWPVESHYKQQRKSALYSRALLRDCFLSCMAIARRYGLTPNRSKIAGVLLSIAVPECDFVWQMAHLNSKKSAIRKKSVR